MRSTDDLTRRPVFISYRRGDTSDAAQAVCAGLMNGIGNVFMDCYSMRAGDDLQKRIRAAVSECSVMVALIGPGWLGATTPAGRRRITEADDYVRWEIGTALDLGLHLVPVLVGGASMPNPSELPLDLAMLTRRLAVEYRDPADAAVVETAVRERQRTSPATRHRPPTELEGIWYRIPNSDSTSQYELHMNGTYRHITLLRQERVHGYFVYQLEHEGAMTVEGDRLALDPIRATTSRSDPDSPGGDYKDTPERLEPRTFRWDVTDGLLTLVHETGAATTYHRLSGAPLR
jgi:hypothetical protein